MSDLQCWNISGLDQPVDGPIYDTYVLAPKAWSTRTCERRWPLEKTRGQPPTPCMRSWSPVKVQEQADILGEPSRIPGVQRIIAATEALGLYDQDNDDKQERRS